MNSFIPGKKIKRYTKTHGHVDVLYQLLHHATELKVVLHCTKRSCFVGAIKHTKPSNPAIVSTPLPTWVAPYASTTTRRPREPFLCITWSTSHAPIGRWSSAGEIREAFVRGSSSHKGGCTRPLEDHWIVRWACREREWRKVCGARKEHDHVELRKKLLTVRAANFLLLFICILYCYMLLLFNTKLKLMIICRILRREQQVAQTVTYTSSHL